jgi:1,2-diacylglycerol 3-alpha-glucosyltransferase/glucuronosyltransferase
VPASGPADLVQDGVNGALSDDLRDACRRALGCSRDEARATALRYGWPASHEVFRAHLVPLVPPAVLTAAPREAAA